MIKNANVKNVKFILAKISNLKKIKNKKVTRKTIKDFSLVLVAKEIFTLSEPFLFSSLTFITFPRHRIFLLIGKTVISIFRYFYIFKII